MDRDNSDAGPFPPSRFYEQPWLSPAGNPTGPYAFDQDGIRAGCPAQTSGFSPPAAANSYRTTEHCLLSHLTPSETRVECCIFDPRSSNIVPTECLMMWIKTSFATRSGDIVRRTERWMATTLPSPRAKESGELELAGRWLNIHYSLWERSSRSTARKHHCHLPRRLLRGDGFEITAGEAATDSNVGFLAGNVGWMSGFFEEPDIDFPNRISRLDPKCRVCRVFYRRGRPQEFEQFFVGSKKAAAGVHFWTPSGLQKRVPGKVWRL